MELPNPPHFTPAGGRLRVAVVGAGIAGLGAAWLLARRHEVTVYEAETRPGGHSHTVDVALEGISHPVDTGFLVFNRRTYPNLCALFANLGVEVVESDMSFAVSLLDRDLEWAGTSLSTVFAQRRNLLRPAFLRMLADILRFNREATAIAVAGAQEDRTLADFLAAGRYGREFRDWYLLPMAAAIWSCPQEKMLAHPVASFARFCHNHALLQVEGRPKWLTVRGGSREYVRRLASGAGELRLGEAVRSIDGIPGAFRVASRSGTQTFDQVVLACHSDQALGLLAHPSAEERSILGRLRYEPNRAVLHTDARLLPRRRSIWSAWNYLGRSTGDGASPVGVSYLINKLQPLPFRTPVIVTLNPPVEPDPGKVIGEFRYEHPAFDREALAAQRDLAAIQGRRGLWFCGAWAGHGFHEDGLRAGIAVANALGCRAPWQEPGEATGFPRSGEAGTLALAPARVPPRTPELAR